MTEPDSGVSTDGAVLIEDSDGGPALPPPATGFPRVNEVLGSCSTLPGPGATGLPAPLVLLLLPLLARPRRW